MLGQADKEGRSDPFIEFTLDMILETLTTYKTKEILPDKMNDDDPDELRRK